MRHSRIFVTLVNTLWYHLVPHVLDPFPQQFYNVLASTHHPLGRLLMPVPLIGVCFHSTTSLSFSNHLIAATIRSWDQKFKGNATNVLLGTISTYLSNMGTWYANCASIVNSSGTGKSRVVDELSKKVITINICLRGDSSNGSLLYFHPLWDA